MIDKKLYESHIGKEQDARDLINSLYWNIKWKKTNGKWKVWAGIKVILETDSKETAEAFIYGMALAYSILPKKYIDQFRSEHNYDGTETE